ncbi:MAG: hypothetical protein RL235_21, partial [Chlamydiota bacterium]
TAQNRYAKRLEVLTDDLELFKAFNCARARDDDDGLSTDGNIAYENR